MIDIDKLAEQVGMVKDGENWFSSGSDDFDVKHEHLVAFAKLVAAAEREACAQICDSVNSYDNPMTANDVADAIRARGQA